MTPFRGSSIIVDFICQQTNINETGFFRNLVNYNLCKVAAMMRTKIQMPNGDRVPVNFYGISLCPSGFSKGKSTNMMEDKVVGDFLDYFVEQTFNEVAEKRIAILASKRAATKNTDPDDEQAKLEADFNSSGELMTQFDEATVPAIKQIRRKLQIADAGSLNLEVDEIGANLIKSTDALTAYLELFDIGKIKEKLVKNTADNTRGIQLKDPTPANMMLYGTPTKLYDGGMNEKAWESFLDMGYARRSFFCFIPTYRATIATKEERRAAARNKSSTVFSDAQDTLLQLGDPSKFNHCFALSEEAEDLLFDYQIWCEERAQKMPDHQDTPRAEMMHRYWKMLKLAGAFAFYDSALQLEVRHLEGAILDTEESGESFARMMKREKDYVRLANYIATCEQPVTHVDIGEDLPFYPAAMRGKRDELINLAMAWASKNSVVIKKHFMESIEMFSGSKLESTNLDEMILSHGPGLAEGYSNELAPWNKIENLLTLDDYNWVNHQLHSDTRAESEIIPGFNMVVLDVDGGTPIYATQAYLSDYEYVICTTKSHTEDDPHYRILLPMSHVLKLGREEFGQFMENIYEHFPITLDTATKDRSRKWATNVNGVVYKNTGLLLDAQSFIPKTKKNEELHAKNKEFKNLDAVERWFISNTGDGNRNNNLLRYAMLLVDSGYELIEVQQSLSELNGKMADSLSDDELNSTIMRSVSKHFTRRGQENNE